MAKKSVNFTAEKAPTRQKHRTVRITQEADDALVERAAVEGRDVADVMRDALQYYFDNVRAKPAKPATAAEPATATA